MRLSSRVVLGFFSIGYLTLFQGESYSAVIVPVTETPEADEAHYSLASDSVNNNTYVYAIRVNPATAQLIFGRSVNSGASWESRAVKVIGNTFAPGHADTGNNKIHVNAGTGDLFVLYRDRNRLRLLKSTDRGENFKELGPLPLTPYGWDLYRMAMDAKGEILYVTVSTFGKLYLTKSTDGGKTFSAFRLLPLGSTREILLSGILQMESETNKDGSELYYFLTVHQWVGRVWRPRLAFARSLDGGMNFGPLTGVRPHPAILDPYYSEHSPSVALDKASGKIYVARTLEHSLSSKRHVAQVLFSESADKGSTFSGETVNDEGSNAQRPSVSVDKAGTARVAFYRYLMEGSPAAPKFKDRRICLDEKPAGKAFGRDRSIHGPMRETESPAVMEPPGYVSRPLAGDRSLAMILFRDFPADRATRRDLFLALDPALPDLAIPDVSYSPRQPVAGEKVTFTVTLKNVGMEAAGPFTLRFFDGPITTTRVVDIVNVPVAGLAAGATESIAVPWTAREGRHTPIFVADLFRKVDELDENNNTFDFFKAPIPVAPGASPWQNQRDRHDVSGDGTVSPIDLLVLINRMNETGFGALPAPGPNGPPPYVDVNGDRHFTPADLLAMSNQINSKPAGPWQNPNNRFDVNGDGFFSPIDLLVLNNRIRRGGAGALPSPGAGGPPPYVDVNGDNYCSPADVLAVVNELNCMTSRPWQNPKNRFDVNSDGSVSPIDLLVLINRINEIGFGALPGPGPNGPPPYVDVNGDGSFTPADLLVMMNEINRV